MDSTRKEGVTPAQLLFADKPIQSAKEDLLGRAAFSKTLAQAIEAWHGDESLTVAVSGDWGSGKTSLKNMVLERLRNSASSPEIIEFNPWKWDTQEKISAAFYKAISIALGRADQSVEGRKRVRRWKRYARALTFGSDVVTDFSVAVPSVVTAAAFFGILAYLLPGTSAQKILGPLAIAALALGAILRFGGSVVSKLASMLSENLEDNELRSLDERKQELSDDLKNMKRSVLVVIDDLDRINKDETRLVIQHLKVNADFPRIIYLMLYHEDIVASHLAEPPVSGKDFLEKIVQLPFEWRDDLRVCSEHVFDRYFMFRIPEGDLSESEFLHLVDSSNDVAAFVQRFVTISVAGQLDMMLDRLDDYASRLPLQNARTLTQALMDLGEQLPAANGRMFEITSDHHLLRIIVRLLTQEEDVSVKGEILLESLKASRGISIPAMIITHDDEVREKNADDTKRKCFNDMQLVSAKTFWIGRVKYLIENDPDKILSNNYLLFILYQWKRWETDEEGPDVWIPKLITSRETAIKFITSVAQISHSHSAGDHVATQTVFVRLTDIEQFISADELARQIDASTLDASKLEGPQLKALEALRNALQRRADGKPDHTFRDR